MRLTMAVAAVVWGILALATLPARAGAAADTVPESLVDVGEYGENIYDEAKADKWDAASKKVASLKEATEKLKKDLGEASDEQKKQLERLAAEITSVDKAVKGKQNQDALIHANQITVIAAELSEPFHPKIPVAVTKLDFLGRELQIWGKAGDLKKVQDTTEEIRKTWTGVRPAVESSGGASQAKVFAEVVKQFDGAKAVGDYVKISVPLLDEVDNLEKVFTK